MPDTGGAMNYAHRPTRPGLRFVRARAFSRFRRGRVQSFSRSSANANTKGFSAVKEENPSSHSFVIVEKRDGNLFQRVWKKVLLSFSDCFFFFFRKCLITNAHRKTGWRPPRQSRGTFRKSPLFISTIASTSNFSLNVTSLTR